MDFKKLIEFIKMFDVHVTYLVRPDKLLTNSNKLFC